MQSKHKKTGQNSLFCKELKQLNELPDHVRNCDNLKSFGQVLVFTIECHITIFASVKQKLSKT